MVPAFAIAPEGGTVGLRLAGFGGTGALVPEARVLGRAGVGCGLGWQERRCQPWERASKAGGVPGSSMVLGFSCLVRRGVQHFRNRRVLR